MTLCEELKLFGYEGDASEFRNLLAELHVNMHPSWTDEELLCNPKYALKFCKVVRSRTSPNLPDRLILRALSNRRKSLGKDFGLGESA